MNTRCWATGKVSFLSATEAKLVMLNIRMAVRKRPRIKHRLGKAGQKHIYYCEYCNGFHLTSWDRKYKMSIQPPIIKKLIVMKY